MRESRGKGITDGKWYYGFVAQEIPETLETYIIPHEIYNCYEYKDNQMNWSLRFEKYHQVDAETVGQYAGTTKQGVKAYEGDVLQVDKFKGVVRWVDGSECIQNNGDDFQIGFILDWKGLDQWRNDLGFWLNQRLVEVVGTIHDNTESLEV